MNENDVSAALKNYQLATRAGWLVEHLDLEAATGDAAARWEIHQIEFLNGENSLTHDTKARQVGWSWTAAADAVVKAKLIPRHTSIFVSINLDEAREKIRYAGQIIEALDSDARPKINIGNRFELELENGSRIISHPCTPVRGKAKADVYLDEFAHYPKDREIYTSVVPVISRGGTIRIGSSPLGASGVFWEIGDEELRAYPGYRRRRIPWWSVYGLCKDVDMASRTASEMPTPERVQTFGTPRLVQIFENMLLEDFQQEFELAFVSQAEAWIAWETIKKNQSLDADDKLWHRHVTVYKDRPETVSEAFRAIDEVAAAILAGHVEGALAGGFDIGRKRNLSEIVLVGKGESSAWPFRLGISLDDVEFEAQRAIAVRCLDLLPVTQMLIDRNGIGMQLAEQLEDEFGIRAQGVDFTNATKEEWAVELRVKMEKGEVPIPLERELAYQIHSIKKKVTPAKNAVFDTERNEKHHADKFWALALATWAARAAAEERRYMRARVV
jgi:phage FluMu gp28-like protein